jgi:hypothetical protein
VNSLPLIVPMASYNNQIEAPSVMKLVLPITCGSSSEPANKKQKKEAQRRVQHVGVQGPFIRSKWSHIPITFSQEDLQLKDYPHNDAMVISCVIKGFLVHNVLVDTGSAADIIFAKAFRQMQEPKDKIHDATHPLCGFGGRQIVALGKMTMSVTFGYVHNTRSIWDQVKKLSSGHLVNCFGCYELYEVKPKGEKEVKNEKGESGLVCVA